jgi:PHD/YefM family antitoxin component YafN of YafNO toxin-antitoxin module
MADSFLPVRPVSEAREQLSRALARFRLEGAAAEPVIFGSHRKPEAVVIPFELYAQLVDRRRRRRAAANATASVLAELPGPVSPAFQQDLERAVEGTISEDELYRRTLERHRRHDQA